MLKQMGVVLQSYVQRCRSFVVGGLVASGLLQVVVTLCVAMVPKPINPMLPFIAMGTVFLGMHLWLQLRLHLITSRRFTWPGYVAPQLIVFTAFALLLAIGWPVAITLIHGSGGIGLTAIVLLMFAVIGWCTATPSWWLMLTAVVGYLWLCFGSITSQRSLPFDRNPLAGQIVIAASVLAIVMAVVHLTRVDEESPTYSKKFNSQNGDLLPKMTGQQSEARRTPSWFQRLFTPSLEKFLPRPGNTWERTLRWRYLRRATLWFPAVFAIGAYLPPFLINHSSSTSRHSTYTGFIVYPVLWMYLFMSGSFVASAWLQSWRYMELEFIRPVARRTLLKDLGLGMVIQIFQTWLIMAFIAACMWRLDDRFGGRASGLAELLSVSLTSQLLGLVVIFWVMSLRSPAGMMFAHLATVFGGGGTLLGLCLNVPNAAPLIAAVGSVALLLTAAALLPVAIRRWDVTDLG